MYNKEVVLYAAGFFDGEGTIYSNELQHLLRVSVGQVDRTPLDYLQAFFGGSICKLGQHKYNGHFRWSLSGEAARTFLEAIRPYVLVKGADIDSSLARVPQRT